MKYIVFWILLNCHHGIIERSYFDEFGRKINKTPVFGLVCDSIRHQKEFTDTLEVKAFIARMKDCDRCVFLKVDTVKIN